jgi:hypothetical protein
LSESATEKKEYPCQPIVLFAAINDLVEMQRGDVAFYEEYDGKRGKTSFAVEMYGFQWEYRFTVENMDADKSRVTLTVGGRAAKDPADKAARQLALLESLLPGTARGSPKARANENGCWALETQ